MPIIIHLYIFFYFWVYLLKFTSSGLAAGAHVSLQLSTGKGRCLRIPQVELMGARPALGHAGAALRSTVIK